MDVTVLVTSNACEYVPYSCNEKLTDSNLVAIIPSIVEIACVKVSIMESVAAPLLFLSLSIKFI